MEDAVASTNRSGLATEGLPGQTDARLDGRLVELNTNAPIRSLACDQIFSRREVKVRLPVTSFCDRGHESPCNTNIRSQILCNSPLILYIRTENLPAPTSCRTLEGLIVNSAKNLADKQISRSIVRVTAEQQEEAILETVREHIHLVETDTAAHADVVITANHGEGVGHGVNVCTALKRSEAAVSESPVTSTHKYGTQPTANAILLRLT